MKGLSLGLCFIHPSDKPLCIPYFNAGTRRDQYLFCRHINRKRLIPAEKNGLIPNPLCDADSGKVHHAADGKMPPVAGVKLFLIFSVAGQRDQTGTNAGLEAKALTCIFPLCPGTEIILR